MGLKDLPHVHAGGHSEWVQHDIYRRAVRKEGHVLFRCDCAMMPLFPWRPAILSPTAIFLFSAM